MSLNGIFRSVWQIKIQGITQKNDFATLNVHFVFIYVVFKKDFLMFPGAFSTIHELKLLSQLFFKKHSKVASFYSVNLSLLIMQIYIKTKHI